MSQRLSNELTQTLQQEVELIRSDAIEREAELQSRATTTAYMATGASCLGTIGGGIAGTSLNFHALPAASFGIGAIAMGIPLSLLGTFVINYLMWPKQNA